jgi:hypothetical protein
MSIQGFREELNMTCLESTSLAPDGRTSNDTEMGIISVFQPSGSEIINKKILHICLFSINHKETPSISGICKQKPATL